MGTIGLLPTADVHVGTFAGLLRELAPAAVGEHVVAADLLRDAQERGSTTT